MDRGNLHSPPTHGHHLSHRSLSPRRRVNAREVSPPPPSRSGRVTRTSGGWVPGRVGLPGGFKESRSMSPLRPFDVEKKKKKEEEEETKTSVETEPEPIIPPKLTRKQVAELAGTWRNSLTKTKTPSSAGLCALWDVTGGGRGPLYDILKAEGLTEEETLQEAVERADKLQEQHEADADVIEALKQALLRCEKIARPHTINAEYKEEWGQVDWGVLPDYDRSLTEVMRDAEETVGEACDRLRSRTEQTLDELCELSQEVHKVKSELEESQALVRALEVEASAAHTKASQQTIMLLELQKKHTASEILSNQKAALQAELDAARQQIAKLTFDHDQLRIEVGRLIKRNRAANKRSKEDMLPLYKEECRGIDVRGPAWVPTGAPYRHGLEEEAAKMMPHDPWPSTG